MCVIMLANVKRPTEDMVERAYNANRDGAGIAWRHKKEVLWRKGLNLKEIQELCAKVPMPYVAHFRVASIGGVRDELTHPFPITPDASLELQGKTLGAVLFHNGHWTDWSTRCLDAAIHSNRQVPSGVWSDSRAMAWLSSIYGPGVMEFVATKETQYANSAGQRVIILGPEGTKIEILGKGWLKVEDVWCSNDGFLKKSGVVIYGSDYCKVHNCMNKNKDASGYCPEHRRNDNTSGSGGTQNVTPFPQSSKPVVGGGRLITMAQAQKLLESKHISRTLFKKIRKQHLKLANSDKKNQAKAKAELEHLSRNVLGSGQGA